jgi:hypothetical protein
MADNAIESAFNPRRLFLILKRDFVNGYRGLLITMAAVGGAMLVVSFLSALVGATGGDIYTPFYLCLIFIGGYIYSATVFKEMHQTGTGSFYLTLPGSRLEKFGSKLLVSSVGFALGMLLFITATSAVSELINRAVLGRGNLVFNPLSISILKLTAVYLVTQSVYVLGSVWFRKLAFLKTALVLCILYFAFAIIAGLVFRLVFADYFTGWSMTAAGQASFNQWAMSYFGSEQGALAWWQSGVLPIFLRVLFWGCVAPVCWIIAYIRLGETEV